MKGGGGADIEVRGRTSRLASGNPRLMRESEIKGREQERREEGEG